MNNALMIVPTYQRLANVVRQIDAFRDTDTTLDVMYVCDSTDPDLAPVVELAEDAGMPIAAMILPGKRTMIEKLNYAAVDHADGYACIGFMGDDHLPRTRHWDRDLVDACEAVGVGMAYPNDLLQGANCPTAVMMTSNIITELGYMTPPALLHMYCDVFWLDLCQQLDAARYLPDTVVEHMHFSNGKSVKDESYTRSNHADVFAKDKVTYDRFLIEEMPGVVARIAALRTGSGACAGAS